MSLKQNDRVAESQREVIEEATPEEFDKAWEEHHKGRQEPTDDEILDFLIQ